MSIQNSVNFREKLSLALPTLHVLNAQLKAHDNFTQFYQEYLFTLHCIIRASVPLMEFALQKTSMLPEADNVRNQLCNYLAKHIPEERSHDDWLLEDLETLGVSRDSVVRRVPRPTIAALVGSQYYWVAHYHPLAILGYIGVLEGAPPTLEAIETIRRRSTLPEESFRTLTKHARLDPIHKQDLDFLLDSLALTSSQSELIGISAFHTTRLACEVFEELLELLTSSGSHPL